LTVARRNRVANGVVQVVAAKAVWPLGLEDRVVVVSKATREVARVVIMDSRVAGISGVKVAAVLAAKVAVFAVGAE
jgi:hypothetical protein